MSMEALAMSPSGVLYGADIGTFDANIHLPDLDDERIASAGYP